MRVVDAIWFNKIGIVLAEDEVTKERKAYIAQGRGDDEQEDIEHIKNFGRKLHPEVALRINKFLNGGKE
jgi:hypothetical protein